MQCVSHGTLGTELGQTQSFDLLVSVRQDKETKNVLLKEVEAVATGQGFAQGVCTGLHITSYNAMTLEARLLFCLCCD